MKKVRYMTVPRMAIELVSKLSTEEKGEFIDFLNSAFKQIEKGEPVTVPETDGIMSVMFEETISELTTGYRNYRQKMTAVEAAQKKKQLKELKEMGIEPEEIADLSPNNQRTIADQSPTDINKTLPNETLSYSPDECDESGRDTGNPAFPEDKEEFAAYWFQIKTWLNSLGVEYAKNDPDILTAWKENGINALRTAYFKLKDQKKPVTKEDFISLASGGIAG